jgi:hypothetical protein
MKQLSVCRANNAAALHKNASAEIKMAEIGVTTTPPATCLFSLYLIRLANLLPRQCGKLFLFYLGSLCVVLLIIKTVGLARFWRLLLCDC